MSSVKDLKAAAKAAGYKGYSNLDREQLETLLAHTSPDDVTETDAAPTVAGNEPEPEPEAEEETFIAVGVPTEPEKANLNETETQSLPKSGRPIKAATTKAGRPTERKRGGVTAQDYHVLDPKLKRAKGAHPDPADEEPNPPPSITGQTDGVGVPTEAKRGGVNKLERELAGPR